MLRIRNLADVDYRWKGEWCGTNMEENNSTLDSNVLVYSFVFNLNDNYYGRKYIHVVFNVMAA